MEATTTTGAEMPYKQLSEARCELMNAGISWCASQSMDADEAIEFTDWFVDQNAQEYLEDRWSPSFPAEYQRYLRRNDEQAIPRKPWKYSKR